MPSLRAEPADVGRHHRNRQPADSRTGVRSRTHLQADDRRGSAGAALQDRPCGVARGVRVVQDVLDLRRDNEQSRVDGRRARTAAAADAGVKIGRTTAIAVIYTGGQIINEAIDMHIQARNSQSPFPQRPNVPQAQSTHVPAPMVYVYEETTWE